MGDDIVIRAEGLGKRYAIGHAAERERYTALRDVVARGARNLWRKTADMARGRPIVAGDTVEEFWALRDVSFEVKRGEVLGIIGRNGAGKSTLLKILSRITEPSEGRVTINGRVASLLEVGTGFHPELTGRENIFLNGAILGMTRAEIRRKFDEIVAFAEVEKFLDTPVKHYSSGMYVRLAFAVAAHLEPEILIVDEVLAVGDAEFQQKCLGKMSEVAGGGRTVLFVSHNMVAARSLTRRGLLLSRGTLVQQGAMDEVITGYMAVSADVGAARRWPDEMEAPGTDAVRISCIQIRPVDPEIFIIGMDVCFCIHTTYLLRQDAGYFHITYHLLNDQGIVVLTTSSPRENVIRSYSVSCEIPANLLNSGQYFLRLLIVENNSRVIYEQDRIASFTVVDGNGRDMGWLGREPGVVQPRLVWSSRPCPDAPTSAFLNPSKRRGERLVAEPRGESA
jgi:lipopolysaccharide transport system ATP-binding protein